MLPFLQAKKAAASIIERRKADGTSKPTTQPDSQNEHPKLMEAAEHIASGDKARIALGLRMAHEHLNAPESQVEESAE